ncbi:His-Xaa-Ser system radical SAM maturase HxsC [Celerinatantimonas diazotrophica]|uniref:His-Xaa-Ser system radical SAM maturase HxsC n=1 Tax=Celerinatantimonas diazotrophica TaxID=412034 RepID=A0A4R1K1G2_9GAMM|nr:His-Xaa-Ser system radical SAM maturase HxsC [Celerinatantimonas diazotrophica]TCK57828.1 His-Xaa-Ser system radical SAM maturase HxsC [Celerinatantimonas diazotrophica]CAG9298108.1 hypothetical protein CEDIAZO_03303 [Celerinatantimonas diazotrophica]
MRNGQPLKTKANIENLTAPLMLEVIDLESFISSGDCNNKHCLLIHEYAPSLDSILKLDWGAVIIINEISPPIDNRLPIATDLEFPNAIASGDVIVISLKRINVLYRRSSHSNLLFVTERCDHRCIMCSQPPKEIDDTWRINECHQLIELIDDDTTTLGVSGGEPTLLGDELLKLIQHAKDTLPKTSLHILTNGCAFEDFTYVSKIQTLAHPHIIWGIPIYGATPQHHDYHTQVTGSFNQTIHGLYNLGHAKQHIELRIVLTQHVVKHIEDIAEFITRNLAFVETVAFMGIEPTGFARTNYQQVWCELTDYQCSLSDSVKRLQSNGIHTALYNIPLCHLPETLHPIAAQSISEWKNTYRDECNSCEKISQCSGFFQSHRQRFGHQRIIPIQSLRSETHGI